ncbi:MAG: hypothetical protein ACQEUH_14585 [Pseudomonadota bacterium]
MRFFAEDLLSALLEESPRPTVQAPRNSRGLYGLVDHHGDLRYIGSTSSTDQTFYERIHQRHRTGSEGMSHYFSQMYNTGRMWRERKDPMTKTDGDVAKALRNEFVVDHCRAVWLPLPDTADIAALEAEVLSLAPDRAIAWNRRRMSSSELQTLQAAFKSAGARHSIRDKPTHCRPTRRDLPNAMPNFADCWRSSGSGCSAASVPKLLRYAAKGGQSHGAGMPLNPLLASTKSQ